VGKPNIFYAPPTEKSLTLLETNFGREEEETWGMEEEETSGMEEEKTWGMEEKQT